MTTPQVFITFESSYIYNKTEKSLFTFFCIICHIWTNGKKKKTTLTSFSFLFTTVVFSSLFYWIHPFLTVEVTSKEIKFCCHTDNFFVWLSLHCYISFFAVSRYNFKFFASLFASRYSCSPYSVTPLRHISKWKKSFSAQGTPYPLFSRNIFYSTVHSVQTRTNRQ